MNESLQVALSKLSRMSSEEVGNHFASVSKSAQNDLVKLNWSVEYDELGHDMHSVAEVSVKDENDALLQIWLRNAASGIWIPELLPWEISVVEFAPEQSVNSAKLGLLDSKWTAEDVGRRYFYHLWGYLMHQGSVESFWLEKSAVYPDNP